MLICRIIYCAILVLSLGMHLALHGEEKTTKYNFGTSLIAAAIQFTLLYFGGFFN